MKKYLILTFCLISISLLFLLYGRTQQAFKKGKQRVFHVFNEDTLAYDAVHIYSIEPCRASLQKLAVGDSATCQIDLGQCHTKCGGYCRSVFTVEAIKGQDTLYKSNFGYYDLGYPSAVGWAFDIRIKGDTILTKQYLMD